MLMQMRVEDSYGFGRITTDDIESEIRRRGVYILEPVARPVTPLPREPEERPYDFVVVPEPLPWQPEERPVVVPEPVPYYPEVLPRPESPVVVLPGDRDIVPIREPWLPQYPIPTEPELEEVFTPPYTEELIMPLTPTMVPGPKPESKVALVLIIAIVALVAFTNNDKGKQAAKWRQPITARSRAM